MKAPGAGGNPDLAGCAVPIDDHLRAIRELNLEHAAFSQLEIQIEIARFKRPLDVAQRGVGKGVEFGVVHGC